MNLFEPNISEIDTLIGDYWVILHAGQCGLVEMEGNDNLREAYVL